MQYIQHQVKRNNSMRYKWLHASVIASWYSNFRVHYFGMIKYGNYCLLLLQAVAASGRLVHWLYSWVAAARGSSCTVTGSVSSAFWAGQSLRDCWLLCLSVLLAPHCSCTLPVHPRVTAPDLQSQPSRKLNCPQKNIQCGRTVIQIMSDPRGRWIRGKLFLGSLWIEEVWFSWM